MPLQGVPPRILQRDNIEVTLYASHNTTKIIIDIIIQYNIHNCCLFNFIAMKSHNYMSFVSLAVCF